MPWQLVIIYLIGVESDKIGLYGIEDTGANINFHLNYPNSEYVNELQW